MKISKNVEEILFQAQKRTSEHAKITFISSQYAIVYIRVEISQLTTVDIRLILDDIGY